MKKLYATLAGMLLFIIAVLGFNHYLDIQIAGHAEIIKNHRTLERFWSCETQKLVMDENTLPVFGSSELVSLEDYSENVSNFLNSPDMNIVTIGEGYFQSLNHTMELGAISEGIESRKVALILSPQWFDRTDGISKEAFPSRFGEENLLEFLRNSKVSDADKRYVLDRTLSLLTDSPVQYARVERYKKAFENKVSLDGIYTDIMLSYWKLCGKYSVLKQIGEMDSELPAVDLEHMDFNEMLLLAEKQGEECCTNNDFGINDKYWDMHLKEAYESGETKKKTEAYEVYTVSQEYEDLRCFLRVAEELDIEVILVSIPVNEAWYTFCGNLCDEYYENIRVISREFDHVILADMTEYADEKYFLKDIMHLGWKGWVRVNEALYREFKKE